MKYLTYKKKTIYPCSVDSYKSSSYGYIHVSVGSIIQDELVGSADTEEDCERFINNLDQQGTFYWVRGIVKHTSIEP